MTGIQYLNVIAGYEFVNDNLAMAVNTTFFILALSKLILTLPLY